MPNTFDRTDAMFCPKCQSEYVEGIDSCPECDEPLVDVLPGRDDGTHPEPVVVLSTGRQEDVVVAKSILMDAGIEYSVLGEGVQDMFGWGRFPAGSNIVVGPIRIVVRPEDEAVATELLSGIVDDAVRPSGDVVQPVDVDDTVLGASAWSRWVRQATRIATIVVLTFIAIEIVWALLSQFWQF